MKLYPYAYSHKFITLVASSAFLFGSPALGQHDVRVSTLPGVFTHSATLGSNVRPRTNHPSLRIINQLQQPRQEKDWIKHHRQAAAVELHATRSRANGSPQQLLDIQLLGMAHHITLDPNATTNELLETYIDVGSEYNAMRETANNGRPLPSSFSSVYQLGQASITKSLSKRGILGVAAGVIVNHQANRFKSQLEKGYRKFTSISAMESNAANSLLSRPISHQQLAEVFWIGENYGQLGNALNLVFTQYQATISDDPDEFFRKLNPTEAYLAKETDNFGTEITLAFDNVSTDSVSEYSRFLSEQLELKSIELQKLVITALENSSKTNSKPQDEAKVTPKLKSPYSLRIDSLEAAVSIASSMVSYSDPKAARDIAIIGSGAVNVMRVVEKYSNELASEDENISSLAGTAITLNTAAITLSVISALNAGPSTEQQQLELVTKQLVALQQQVQWLSETVVREFSRLNSRVTSISRQIDINFDHLSRDISLTNDNLKLLYAQGQQVEYGVSEFRREVSRKLEAIFNQLKFEQGRCHFLRQDFPNLVQTALVDTYIECTSQLRDLYMANGITADSPIQLKCGPFLTSNCKDLRSDEIHSQVINAINWYDQASGTMNHLDLGRSFSATVSAAYLLGAESLSEYWVYDPAQWLSASQSYLSLNDVYADVLHIAKPSSFGLIKEFIDEGLAIQRARYELSSITTMELPLANLEQMIVDNIIQMKEDMRSLERSFEENVFFGMPIAYWGSWELRSKSLQIKHGLVPNMLQNSSSLPPCDASEAWPSIPIPRKTLLEKFSVENTNALGLDDFDFVMLERVLGSEVGNLIEICYDASYAHPLGKISQNRYSRNNAGDNLWEHRYSSINIDISVSFNSSVSPLELFTLSANTSEYFRSRSFETRLGQQGVRRALDEFNQGRIPEYTGEIRDQRSYDIKQHLITIATNGMALSEQTEEWDYSKHSRADFDYSMYDISLCLRGTFDDFVIGYILGHQDRFLPREDGCHSEYSPALSKSIARFASLHLADIEKIRASLYSVERSYALIASFLTFGVSNDWYTDPTLHELFGDTGRSSLINRRNFAVVERIRQDDEYTVQLVPLYEFALSQARSDSETTLDAVSVFMKSNEQRMSLDDDDFLPTILSLQLLSQHFTTID